MSAGAPAAYFGSAAAVAQRAAALVGLAAGDPQRPRLLVKSGWRIAREGRCSSRALRAAQLVGAAAGFVQRWGLIERQQRVASAASSGPAAAAMSATSPPLPCLRHF